MEGRVIEVSELREKAKELRAGDRVLLSGYIYTARDAAHKRIFELLEKGEELPFPIEDSVIYYAGPTPTPPGKIVGSIGPTTSGRMDKFAPKLMDLGLVCTVGKGPRSQEVIDAIVRNGGCYLCAVGGAGALAAGCVKSCEEIAFFDLGCESIKKLYVEKFPLIVAIDCKGNSLFE